MNGSMLKELFKNHFDWNGARIECIIQLILALFKVRTVNLVELSQAFSGNAKDDSNYKRLQRLFREVDLDFKLFAQFIAKMLPLDKFKLTIDRTNWKFGKTNINILMLAVVYKGSAFPLFWDFFQKKEIPTHKNVLV